MRQAEKHQKFNEVDQYLDEDILDLIEDWTQEYWMLYINFLKDKRRSTKKCENAQIIVKDFFWNM